MFNFFQKGFSILELLIVISIMSILLAGGSGFYHSFSKNVELTSTAKIIVGDLRHMQAKAMAQESDLKWGIHFVNETVDYYELFSTPTTYNNASMTVSATTTLPNGITFSVPSADSTQDVIFNKVAGTTTSATVGLSSGDVTHTITISALGTIY